MVKTKFCVDLPEIAKYDYRRNHDRCLSMHQELMSFIDHFDISDCFFRGQKGCGRLLQVYIDIVILEEKFRKAVIYQFQFSNG
jgi:hypothetical protein